MKAFFQHGFLLMLVPLLWTACASTKDVTYFQTNREVVNNERSVTYYDARIMPKDVLTITVNTINPTASLQFNLLTPTSQTTLQTYLVDNDGKINFPVIGELKVGGLTKTEAEQIFCIMMISLKTKQPIGKEVNLQTMVSN